MDISEATEDDLTRYDCSKVRKETVKGVGGKKDRYPREITLEKGRS